MASARISAKYPPQIDPTRTPLAYGDRALPRLNIELNDSTLVTRQRAVKALCNHLHDCENIAETLRVGIAESLKTLLSDPDITVRQKATESLYVIGQHAVGRDAFLDFDIIEPLSLLFDDPEDIARLNAHKAIEIVSETPPGAEGIVEAGLVPKLVLKLKDEHDEIKEFILDTLHFCMRVDTTDALASEGMEMFTSLLAHESHTIRAKAARDIMDLSVPLSGKKKAVKCDSIAQLVPLLLDQKTSVKANAAGAIMTITITTEGKYNAIKNGAIENLVELVEDFNSEVKVNSLKALTCLSEAPEGRAALLPHVEKIEALCLNTIPAVAKHATIAVRSITWKP